jgi:hypothetical protein
MAMVYGNDDADSMADWGEDHEEWLKSLLELPHGSPSQDVLLSVVLSPPNCHVVLTTGSCYAQLARKVLKYFRECVGLGIRGSDCTPMSSRLHARDGCAFSSL